MPFRIEISGFNVVRNSIDAKKTGLACGIFCLTVVLSGCEQSDSETRGDREAKSGHFDAAINWYEAALGQGDKVAVHKKMAEIFAYKLKDSPSAAYHYRRIVALNPSHEKTESARNSVCKLEHADPADAPQANNRIVSQFSSQVEESGAVRRRASKERPSRETVASTFASSC